MVMSVQAWNLKAWWAPYLPEHPRWRQRHQAQKRRVLQMEVRTFVIAFVEVLCQIIRTGWKLVKIL